MKKNMQIEGLRGFTLLLIMIYHFSYRYVELFGTEALHPFAFAEFWGQAGVAIFCIISGYLMFNGEIKERNFFFFFIRKMKRLYKPYLVAIVIIAALVKIFGLPGRECGLKDFILNALFLNGFLGTPYVDGAHWYLTYLLAFTIFSGVIICLKLEEKAYMPLLLLAFSIILEIACRVIPIHIISTICRYLSCRYYICFFLLGVLTSKIHFNVGIIGKNIIYLGTVVLDVVILIWRTDDKGALIWLVIVSMLAICTIKEKVHILNNRLLVFLGSISFQVYLIHQNIGYIILNNLQSMGLNYGISIVITIMLTIILGWCISRAIVVPFRIKKHRETI